MANVITYGVTLDANGAINGFKRLDGAIDANAAKVTRWEALAKRAGAAVGLAVGTTAVLALRKVIVESSAAQAAQAQLVAALKSTGGAAGLTASQLNAQSAAMQRTTAYADDTVTAMQSVLLTFTKVGAETFPRATRAIADLATRMGGDLQGAAVQVGKALNDPVVGITALTRVGVSFTNAQKEVIKNLAETNRLAEAQAMILRELEIEFGGSAEAARHTLGGALKALSNQFGDLFELDAGKSSVLISTIESMTEGIRRLGVALEGLDDIAVRLRLMRPIGPTADSGASPLVITTARDRGLFGNTTGRAITITAEVDAERAAASARRKAFDEAQRNAAERARWEEEAINRAVRLAQARFAAENPGGPRAPGASATTLGWQGERLRGITEGRGVTALPPGMRIDPGAYADSAEAAARAAAERVIRIEQETADERMQIQENFLRGAQSAMSGFFRTLLTDGIGSFRDLMASFRTLILSTVAELAAQRLMERVFSGGKGGAGGLLGFLGGPIGIAAGVFGLGAALAGGRSRNAPVEQYRRPSPWQAAELDRLRAENAALATRATEGNQLRQSMGGVLTETSASRIVGNLEAIRVGIFRLVGLAEAGAMGGATVTVNGGSGTNTSPGASVAALVDRAMGVTTQRLRLASGAAVIA